MNYATWNEILIELVFAVSGETKLEKLAEKAAVTFLRKLDCAQVSILQYKNNNLKPIFAVPHVLLRRKDYNELIVRLEKILKNSNKEFITFVEKNLYYHAFSLRDFGILLLGRADSLEDIFLKELTAVTNILAQNCFYSFDTVQKKKMIESELRQERHLLRAVMDTIPDLIFFRDINGVYKGANKATAKFFSLAPKDIVGNTIWDLHSLEEADLCYKTDRKVIESGRMERYETELKCDGHSHPFEILKAPIYNEIGECTGIVAVCRDIKNRKHYEQELEYYGTHDQLTDLYNRRFLEQEIEYLDVEEQLPISIIMGDLDGLKLINDIFGHQEGDRLIIKAAETIKKSCRQNDLILRWGGDEFVVFLPQTGFRATRKICKRIEENCGQQKCGYTQMSMALGWATKNSIDKNIWHVLKEANDLMYSTKLLNADNFKNAFISSFKTTFFAKNIETKEHRKRLRLLCREIGKRLGLNLLELERLELLAVYRDIGKVAIKEEVLLKHGSLTAKELEEFKKHPEIGSRFAKTVPGLYPITEEILFHHEQWDGSGYPQGLKGEEIPLLSRIFAIINAFNILTGSKGLFYKEALVFIKNNGGKKYDPKISNDFYRLMQTKEIIQALKMSQLFKIELKSFNCSI